MICARRPFSPTAEAIVTTPDERLGVPADVKAAGYEYFLEADVAAEVLEVLGDRRPTHDEKVRLLIHYAEHDAYPEWVYQR